MTTFVGSLTELVAKNSAFRFVLYTGERQQMTAMRLRPRESIGEEIHDFTEQLVIVVGGSGEAIVAGRRITLQEGTIVLVPSGSSHDFRAGDSSLRLLVVYSPPLHADGIVQERKENAEGEEVQEGVAAEESRRRHSPPTVSRTPTTPPTNTPTTTHTTPTTPTSTMTRTTPTMTRTTTPTASPTVYSTVSPAVLASRSRMTRTAEEDVAVEEML